MNDNNFRAAYDPRVNALVGRAAMLTMEFQKAARWEDARRRKQEELGRLFQEKEIFEKEAETLAKRLGANPERLKHCFERLSRAARAAGAANDSWKESEV